MQWVSGRTSLFSWAARHLRNGTDTGPTRSIHFRLDVSPVERKWQRTARDAVAMRPPSSFYFPFYSILFFDTFFCLFGPVAESPTLPTGEMVSPADRVFFLTISLSFAAAVRSSDTLLQPHKMWHPNWRKILIFTQLDGIIHYYYVSCKKYWS